MKRIRISLAGILLLIFTASAFSQARFEGRIQYASVNPVSLSIDTTEILIGGDRILMFSPMDDTAGTRIKTIIDLTSKKQYWINDARKVALVSSIRDDYSLRDFQLQPGRVQVQGTSCRIYISEMDLRKNDKAGVEDYQTRLWVAETEMVSPRDTGLYLVNYGILKGRLIVKKESEIYFPKNDKPRRYSLTLMKMEEMKPDAAGLQVPSGYQVIPFSMPVFLQYFERPGIERVLEMMLR